MKDIKKVRKLFGTRNDGFTLVELIVTLAILAILVAAIIHIYTGYMRRTANTSVIAELEMVSKAVQIANAGGGAVSEIIVEADGALTINGDLKDDFHDNFRRYYLACELTNNVKYISVEGSCGGTQILEVYSSEITLLCFEDLASGSDYENGAVWTSDKGWIPAE